MTTRPLTPESEATVKALAGMSADDGMEVWLRKRMEISEAAAVARDREGLVEVVARNLHSYIEDDMDFACIHWEERGVRHKGCTTTARRLLALDAPEAQEADR